jgi:hypothetical protein
MLQQQQQQRQLQTQAGVPSSMMNRPPGLSQQQQMPQTAAVNLQRQQHPQSHVHQQQQQAHSYQPQPQQHMMFSGGFATNNNTTYMSNTGQALGDHGAFAPVELGQQNTTNAGTFDTFDTSSSNRSGSGMTDTHHLVFQ